jgi:hypothetical protein
VPGDLTELLVCSSTISVVVVVVVVVAVVVVIVVVKVVVVWGSGKFVQQHILVFMFFCPDEVVSESHKHLQISIVLNWQGKCAW